MSFLFVLVHFSFAFAYLFIGSMMGGIVFFFLGLVSFFYFYPAFHAMGRERFGDRFVHPVDLDADALRARGIFFLRQASFYFAFFLFYGAIGGIAWTFGWDFSEISLFLSLGIVAVAWLSYDRRPLMVFLLVRSNFIVSALAYTAGFSLLLVYGLAPSWMEMTNLFVTFIGLVGIVALDPLLDDRNRSGIYGGTSLFFLFIVFFSLERWFGVPILSLGLSTLIVGGVILSEWCHYVPALARFGDVSDTIGNALVYVGFSVVFIEFFSGNQATDVLILLAIVFSFHLTSYIQTGRFASFLTQIAIGMTLYIHFFFDAAIGSAVMGFIFILGLPIGFVLLTYLFSLPSLRDVYLLHSFALVFALGGYGYLVFHMYDTFLSVMNLSIFGLAVSMLLFAIFLRYQRAGVT